MTAEVWRIDQASYEMVVAVVIMAHNGTVVTSQ